MYRAAIVVLAGCGSAMRPARPSYFQDVPQATRTIESAMTAVASARPDATGIAYAGATSRENRYTLDGADITDPRRGPLRQTLPLQLIDTLDVTTGGAGVDQPSATGAVIAATTRAGSNEFHASAFTSIDVRPELGAAEVGATASGPLARDQLWLSAGVAPEPSRDAYPMLARVDGALGPDHLAWLTLYADPGSARAADAIVHERSRFDDNRGEIGVMLAAHHALGDRHSARVDLLHRARLAGWHTFEAGGYGERSEQDGVRSRAGALYAHDLWQVLANVAVDAGLRYSGHAEPRVGVAWDPTGESTAKLFARWGRYVDATQLDETLAGIQVAEGDTVLAVTYQQRHVEPTRRDYDAFEVIAARHTARLWLQASYVHSRTLGPYVVVDRPHLFKLDAAYAFGIARRTTGSVGVRARAGADAPDTDLSYGVDLRIAVRHYLRWAASETYLDVYAQRAVRLGFSVAF